MLKKARSRTQNHGTANHVSHVKGVLVFAFITVNTVWWASCIYVVGLIRAVLPHDAVGRRETEPGAPADILRREERLEYHLQVFDWNTDSGVGN